MSEGDEERRENYPYSGLIKLINFVLNNFLVYIKLFYIKLVVVGVCLRPAWCKFVAVIEKCCCYNLIKTLLNKAFFNFISAFTIN